MEPEHNFMGFPGVCCQSIEMQWQSLLHANEDSTFPWDLSSCHLLGWGLMLVRLPFWRIAKNSSGLEDWLASLSKAILGWAKLGGIYREVNHKLVHQHVSSSRYGWISLLWWRSEANFEIASGEMGSRAGILDCYWDWLDRAYARARE